MKRTIQSCICIYLVFLIFCMKKISGDSTSLTQKERYPKRNPNLFFWEALLRSLTVATPLEMSRAKFRIRLKWPNMYLCFAWYSFCLFIYVWWDVLWCLMYGICCLYCLLKSFPNYHSVCHPNNNVCTPFNIFVVVVTMDHRSSLDSGTQWWTYQLIAQSHWIISYWL